MGIKPVSPDDGSPLLALQYPVAHAHYKDKIQREKEAHEHGFKIVLRNEFVYSGAEWGIFLISPFHF
jgi:hypothetical protein